MYYSRHNQTAVCLAAVSLAFISLAISATGSWIYSTTAPTVGAVPTSTFTNLMVDPNGGYWTEFSGDYCGTPSAFPSSQGSMMYSCRTRKTALAFGILAAVFTAWVLYWAIVHDHDVYRGHCCGFGPCGNNCCITLPFFLAGSFALISFTTGYRAYRAFYNDVVGFDFDMDYSFALMIAAWILLWLGAILYCCMHRRHRVATNPVMHRGNGCCPGIFGGRKHHYNNGYNNNGYNNNGYNNNGYNNTHVQPNMYGRSFQPYNAPYGAQPVTGAPALG